MTTMPRLLERCRAWRGRARSRSQAQAMQPAERRFAGADWILAVTKKPLSDIGVLAADILGDVFAGIYHVEGAADVDWTDHGCITVPLNRSLATWDFDHLTRLVVLAHDRCVRIEVRAEYRCVVGTGEYEGMEDHHADLVLMFHKRQREGPMMTRHPTLEQAVKAIRRSAPA